MIDVVLEALITRAVAALSAGHVRAAEVMLIGAQDFATRNDLPAQYIRASVNLSANLCDVDPHATIEVVEKGLAVAAHLGMKAELPYLVGNGIDAGGHLARWDWCTDQLESLLEIFSDHPMVPPGRVILSSLLGDVDEARKAMANVDLDTASMNMMLSGLEAALTLAFVEGKRLGLKPYERQIARLDQWVQGQLFVMLARVAYLSEDGEGAAWARERMAAELVPNLWQTARLATIDAALAALAGRQREAVDLYAKVLPMWDDLALPLDKAQCQFDFALLVDSPEADAARGEARAFFDEMGNNHLVRQLDERRLNAYS
jgi:hypothetical protein